MQPGEDATQSGFLGASAPLPPDITGAACAVRRHTGAEPVLTPKIWAW